MRVPASLLVIALAIPAPAIAEQVILKNGGRISGILVERSASHVVMQIGPGQVKIPLANVERVVEGRSALATFAERAERLQPTDREGWLDLGLWARDAGLETQARQCFERVLALDPQNAIAQAGVGNVLLNGRWLNPDEAYRARGYVRFEGSWMLPEERDERLRDLLERGEAARARAEAQARIAEAEARARAAEEQARRQAATTYSHGIPWGYVYGPSAVVGPMWRGRLPRHHWVPGSGHANANPTPTPPPRPVMRDTGSTRSSPERSR
jgi:hypothetical protein